MINSNLIIKNYNDTYHKMRLEYKNNRAHIFRYTRKTTVPNNTDVCTIPERHRPSSTILAFSTCIHSSGKAGIAQLTIYSDGRVSLGALNYNEDLAG